MKHIPLLLGTLFLSFAACTQATGDNVGSQGAALEGDNGDHDGDVDAKGAFTCDLQLAGDAFTPNAIAPAIERDRMIMSRADGFLHKHIPIALDFAHSSGGQPDLFTGGRYLFKTEHDADFYKNFVENTYYLDGVEFLDRPYWLAKECHSFTVVGAHDFTDIHTSQVIIRTERFQMAGNHPIDTLQDSWHAIKAAAKAEGMASVWLAYNEDENLATIVYTHDRIVPENPTVPDFASLNYLAGLTPLGDILTADGFTRTFDLTHWVFTIWFPFDEGDTGEPSLWPHSPPFGEPFCGDGVCEVSRGEDNASCPADCEPHCGNAVCEPKQGENDLNCPGDCGPNTADPDFPHDR
jgi:hypothetical protein